MEALAKQYNQELEKFKESLQEAQMNYIGDKIKTKKAMTFLVENSKAV
jgi:hypothetical protein